MVFVSDEGIQHFSSTHTLNPEGLASLLADAHHQGAGGVIAEGHVKCGRDGQDCRQNRLCRFRRDIEQQSPGKFAVVIREKQEAVVVGHKADVRV